MELQNKRNIAKNIFFDILCFTLGGILYGISVSVFSEPNQIAPGRRNRYFYYFKLINPYAGWYHGINFKCTFDYLGHCGIRL